MRRRQIYALRNSAVPVSSSTPAGPPDCGLAAPEAVTNPSPPPVADKLSYHSKAGSIVTIRANGINLEMWTGSQWVAAHVVPSKGRKR